MGCGSSTAKTSTPGGPVNATAHSSPPEDIAGQADAELGTPHVSNSPKPAKYSSMDAAASLGTAADAPTRTRADGPEHNGNASAPSSPTQQNRAAHRPGAASPNTLPPVRGALGGPPLKTPLTCGMPMLPEDVLSDRSPSPSGRTENDKDTGRHHHHKHKHKHHKHKHHDRSRSTSPENQKHDSHRKHEDKGQESKPCEDKPRGDKNFDLGDFNGNGVIDFAEFCSMNCVKGRSDHELKRIFKRLDINGDKKLDRKEFRKFEDDLFQAADGDSNFALDFKEFAALRCNQGRDEQQLREIFALLDRNHDGKIDRDEFKKLDLKTKETIDHQLGTHHKYLHCDDKTKHKRLSLGAYAVEHKDEMEEMINSGTLKWDKKKVEDNHMPNLEGQELEDPDALPLLAAAATAVTEGAATVVTQIASMQSDNTETLKTHELMMMYTPAQAAKAQKDLDELRRKEREYADDSADKFDKLQKAQKGKPRK